MDEKELEQAVKKLLVEACSSRRVLEPGIDLLESGCRSIKMESVICRL